MTKNRYSLEQVTRIARARRHAADGTGRKIRLAARVTLEQVASVVGVYPADISRWERGAMPSPKNALAWMDLLDHLEREFAAPKS